jgi:tetratricopeptide (TPR) repeat protein
VGEERKNRKDEQEILEDPLKVKLIKILFRKSLELDEESGNKKGKANQLGNIGAVYLTKGELDKALEYHEKALKIFKDLGSRIETAQTLATISEIFIQQGDKERALEYYREAQNLAVGSSFFEKVSKRLKELKE